MDQPCSICYTDIEDDSGLKTKCNHVFHRECMKSWMQEIAAKWKNSSVVSPKSAPMCPYCRQPVQYLKLAKGEKEEVGVHSSLYKAYQEKRIKDRKNKLSKQNTSKGKIVAKHCTKNKYIKSKAKLKPKPKKKCIASTQKGKACRNQKNPQYGLFCGTHKKHYFEMVQTIEKELAAPASVIVAAAAPAG